MWQQHFGTPYETEVETEAESKSASAKSFSNLFSEGKERLENMTPAEREDLERRRRESVISFAELPVTKRKQTRRREALDPRQHPHRQAEKHLAFAFAGGLLVGLLLNR